MNENYPHELLNSKIKNSNIKNSRSLHHFLGLDSLNPTKIVGLVFGKFYPLHTGHIYLIQRACNQVSKLHIIIGYDELRDHKLFQNSAMSQQPTYRDRFRWLLQTFQHQKNIKIHLFNEKGIEAYPQGWKNWSLKIKDFLKRKGIEPHCVYTSEENDVLMYKNHLSIPAILVDSNRSFINVSGSKIRNDPFYYWEYIPIKVKPFFVRKVVVLGSSFTGKTTLVNKLASIFNTTSAWEYRRNYISSYLGGDEMALQYSDYYKIALGQAQNIDFAIKHANKVTFIDTDFITIQAFYLQNKGDNHPFIQHLINERRFDLVILLDSSIVENRYNTLQNISILKKYTNFQSILITMLNENSIKFIYVKEDNYDSRFLQCVKLVKNIL